MSDDVKPRLTLREMAQQASGVEQWECPRCGCRDWRVVGTYFIAGGRRRQRACRHCNERLITREVPVPEGYRIEIVRDDP